MNRFREIQCLLRLAELCDASESERKRSYMDRIDALIEEEKTIDITVDHAGYLVFFDFDASADEWHWMSLDALTGENPDLFAGVSHMHLGRYFAEMSRENIGIKRRHTRGGTQYFLPPLKKRRQS